MKRWSGETRFLTRRWPELSEEEEKLYDLLVPENRTLAINLDDFSDLYGQEVVTRDKKLVAEREAEFQRQAEADPESKNLLKRGELFEAIINDQIEQSEWLGEDASVIVPARYDDIENGVDSIVEFEIETGRSHLALAVDVTKSTKQLDKKFDAIKNSIKNGRLSRVKYFRSKDIRGELKEVPKVVVGADEETMQEVAGLLLIFKTRQKHRLAEKAEEFWITLEALKNHRLQLQITEEIMTQLKAFAKYARKLGKDQIAAKYESALNIMSRVAKEKENEAGDQYAANRLKINEDSVYKMIIEKAECFA